MRGRPWHPGYGHHTIGGWKSISCHLETQFFSSVIFQSGETGKNCINAWNVSKKSILGHGWQFGFAPLSKIQNLSPENDKSTCLSPLLTQMHFVFSIPVFVSTNRQIEKPVDKRICFQIASLVWSLLFEVKGIANHNINTWGHLRTTFHVNFDSYLTSTQLDKTVLKEILLTRWHLKDAGPSIIIHTIDNLVLEINV